MKYIYEYLIKNKIKNTYYDETYDTPKIIQFLIDYNINIWEDFCVDNKYWYTIKGSKVIPNEIFDCVKNKTLVDEIKNKYNIDCFNRTSPSSKSYDLVIMSKDNIKESKNNYNEFIYEYPTIILSGPNNENRRLSISIPLHKKILSINKKYI